MNCVKARTIYTGEKAVRDSYLAWGGRTIAGLAGRKRGRLLGEYAAVTPAFIDAHAHIGMVRFGEPGGESDMNEKISCFTPLADPLDAIMMDDDSFRDGVAAGVLYSCVMPGSANAIGGRSVVIRNYARSTGEALICRAGVKAALGLNTTGSRTMGGRPWTRMGTLAVLRDRLDEVRRKIRKHRRLPASKKHEVDFTAADEVIRGLLDRREMLRVHCHKVDDIHAMLRLVEEFGLRASAEHTLDVEEPAVYHLLKERGIPVVYGPLDTFVSKVEIKHERGRNVRCLVDSGVEYGLMSDHPIALQRTMIFGLRWFLRAGLSRAQAIAVPTRNNARILGLERFLGTLRRGKWASFVCWNGDPFDLRSYPVAVWAEGQALELKPD